MKKIILSIAALFVFTLTFAQEETVGGFSKGDVLVGGGIMINSEKDGDVTTTSFGIIPMVQYFVTDNIAAGLTVGYESHKVKTGNISTDGNVFMVEANGRYVFTPKSRFSLFGQLGVSYSSMDFGLAKLSGVGVSVNPGIHFFLNEHFVLYGALGGLEYTSVKADSPGAEAVTNVGFEFKIAKMDFGLAYKF